MPSSEREKTESLPPEMRNPTLRQLEGVLSAFAIKFIYYTIIKQAIVFIIYELYNRLRNLKQKEVLPMRKQISKLEHMPIGITGACLAFITLSNSWQLNGIGFVKPLAVFLAVCMLALTALRALLFPKAMWAELKHPVTGTFYPTIGMATWLVSAYFHPAAPVLCELLWLAAAAWHYFVIGVYTVCRWKERKLSNIVPTCFIVYTGMITGCIASKGMSGPLIPMIAQFMLYFGFWFYTILLPLNLWIVFRSGNLTDATLPTVGILCSPAPLGVVGMLTIQESPNLLMLGWLTLTGLLLLPVVYCYVWKLFAKGFRPTYAGFTFPLAIATLAAYRLSEFWAGLGYDLLGKAFQLLGDVEIFIASYVVGYVLFHFLRMFVLAVLPPQDLPLAPEGSLEA